MEDLPDDVARKFAGQVSLAIRMLPSVGPEAPSVLIEGDRRSLEFLAALLLAVASDEDCGYGIQPGGAGSAHFAANTELGIYLHRLPCVNDDLKSR